MRDEINVINTWAFAALISIASQLFMISLITYRNIQPFIFIPNYLGFFPFGLNQPLGNLTLILLVNSTLVYFLVGFAKLKDFLLMKIFKDFNVSLLISTVSFAILFYIVPLLSQSWLLAIYGNHVPINAWGIPEGNHGPWRHIYDIRKLLLWTIQLPILSLTLGLLSLFINKTRIAIASCLFSIIFFLLLLHSHYWLID